jgi:tetratricopeptide (TPR) repeat protein
MNENTSRETEADPRTRAMVWTNKGLTLVQQQRFQEGLGCFEKALVLFQQGNERIRVAEQWGNIGSAYRDLEQPDHALENYQRALAIYRELGHTERIADQCTNIAYTRFMQQDHADALKWYREALTLYTAAGSEPKRRLTEVNVDRLEAVLGET